jgi:UDP-glucose 4-epimerase
MKSLITGGAGFIGSHLAKHLLESGEEVVVLDDLSTGRFDNIRGLVENDRFCYFVGLVEDKDLLSEAAEGVDVIYHLAAAVGVELIVRDPVRTIETNIMGTAQVLHHAVRYGKKVLLTSTSEVYGKSNRLPFREDDDVVYGPTSKARWAYAVSKAVDEFLLKAYVSKKGLPGVVVRLFNTVGPRQVGHYGMVVPRFVGQALRGGPITVYGTGQQSRCFAHVADIVPALRQLAHTPRAHGLVVNLGGQRSVTIQELAEIVRARVNPTALIKAVTYEEAYGDGFEDMQERIPAIDRARDLIGFNPGRSLEQIIDDVAADLKQEGA